MAESPTDLWHKLKREENAKSEAMEELLKLTGLEKVKNKMISLFGSALFMNKQTSEVRKQNARTLNFCLLGNPVIFI